MIVISANTTTNVALTLYEKTTLTGATYIMDLYSNQNHNHTYFWLTGDTTNNNVRYNYFPVNISGLNLSGGTYDYFVWQTTGNTLSTTGLTINDIVESGLCEIIANVPLIPTGTTYNNPKTEYTFY